MKKVTKTATTDRWDPTWDEYIAALSTHEQWWERVKSEMNTFHVNKLLPEQNLSKTCTEKLGCKVEGRDT